MAVCSVAVPIICNAIPKVSLCICRYSRENFSTLLVGCSIAGAGCAYMATLARVAPQCACLSEWSKEGDLRSPGLRARVGSNPTARIEISWFFAFGGSFFAYKQPTKTKTLRLASKTHQVLGQLVDSAICFFCLEKSADFFLFWLVDVTVSVAGDSDFQIVAAAIQTHFIQSPTTRYSRGRGEGESMDWDADRITFADQSLASTAPSDPSELSPAQSRVLFREFFRNYRDADDQYVYTDQLQKRWQRREPFVEVHLAHVGEFHEGLMAKLQSRPAEYLPMMEAAAKEALSGLLIVANVAEVGVCVCMCVLAAVCFVR